MQIKQFSNFSQIIFFWWGLGRAGSGDCKTFSRIPDLYPLDVISIPVAMTTKMSPDSTVFP